MYRQKVTKKAKKMPTICFSKIGTKKEEKKEPIIFLKSTIWGEGFLLVKIYKYGRQGSIFTCAAVKYLLTLPIVPGNLNWRHLVS